MPFETYKGRTLVQMKIHANEQRAEITRLRAALQHIAALHPMTDQDTGFVDNSAQDTASAALNPS